LISLTGWHNPIAASVFYKRIDKRADKWIDKGADKGLKPLVPNEPLVPDKPLVS